MSDYFSRLIQYVLVCALCSASLLVYAEQGDWLVRLRGVGVVPLDDSGLISLNGAPLAGSGVTVGNSVIPELDITYMFHRNWGVEVIAGTAPHDVELEGPGPVLAGLGLTDGFKIFDTWVLPPTVLLQYHFLPEGSFRPYVGVGANYTAFLGENATRNLEATIGSVSVQMSDSWGWAAQGGVDITVKDNWFINLDVKYIDMNSTASLGTALGRLKVDVDIDPLVFGAGIGYRF